MDRSKSGRRRDRRTKVAYRVCWQQQRWLTQKDVPDRRTSAASDQFRRGDGSFDNVAARSAERCDRTWVPRRIPAAPRNFLVSVARPQSQTIGVQPVAERVSRQSLWMQSHRRGFRFARMSGEPVRACQRKVEMSGFLPDRNGRFHGLLQGWFAGAWYLGVILFLGLGVCSASPGGRRPEEIGRA